MTAEPRTTCPDCGRGHRADVGCAYPFGERNAMAWTDEFDRIYPDRRPDRDTMLGWFANAIETGVMIGERADLPVPALDPERLARALCAADIGHYRNWGAAESHATVLPHHEDDAQAIIVGYESDLSGSGSPAQSGALQRGNAPAALPVPALDALREQVNFDIQTAELLEALDRRNVQSAGDLERYDRQSLDMERLRRGVHAWFCTGKHDRAHVQKRPHIGWACERGAKKIADEYAALGSQEEPR